jgi:hypothetical protein
LALPLVYHGVDFSGGKRAHRKIRVADQCPGEPIALRSSLSHSRLVEAIARSAEDGRRHRWLIDSTFGLPLEMLEVQGVETDWVASLRWMASFSDARQWRRASRRKSRKELKRRTDRLAAVPFAPVNLRMFRQTWHCMVSVLLPLFERPGVAVLPFAAASAVSSPGESSTGWEHAPVWIGEGCPASFLRRAGWPYRGYKGPSGKNLDLRRDLLARLAETLETGVPPDIESQALEDTDGDALDSLLLLPSARRFSECDHRALVAREPRAGVEGWVYV